VTRLLGRYPSPGERRSAGVELRPSKELLPMWERRPSGNLGKFLAVLRPRSGINTLIRKWHNTGRRVECLEVLGTCIIGGISAAYNDGEQHSQRDRVYEGHNGVSINTLTKILRNLHN
jgi:hypothetical protein